MTKVETHKSSCFIKTASRDHFKFVSMSSLESSASEGSKRESLRKLKRCLKKTKSHEPKTSNRLEINLKKTAFTNDDINVSKNQLMKDINVSSKILIFSKLKALALIKFTFKNETKNELIKTK